ncbi:MAG: flagellar assembly protein FliW [bacterium]|nr:flagellar assembly protein FliW [bacterium]
MPSFKTVRFGDLDYRDDDVITLPEGLLGMPTLQRWLMLEMGENVPMKWFQSLDRADFGFPVCQPGFFHDEYAVDVPTGLQERLGAEAPEDLITLIITTVHPGGERVTGNLLAPMVIAAESRRGAQVVQESDGYGIRQEIDYLKFGLAVHSDAVDNGEATESSADREPGVEESIETQESVVV